jgi:hypothetical protein
VSYWPGLMKTITNSDTVLGLRVNISTRDLEITKHECYPLDREVPEA